MCEPAWSNMAAPSFLVGRSFIIQAGHFAQRSKI